MAGLVLRGVSKSFDGTPVLREVSLELADGELAVVLGPSGCGKTTLLRIIAGLETPDAGEVYIGNRRVDLLRPRERNVALVFQNYSLYPHMTVEQNLAFPLRAARVPRREIRQRVARVAELIGLSERLKSRPGELSGGQRQRVALGRAIIREPALFLLDEPLSNLDADLRVRMRGELVALQRKLGTTLVHVTHDQSEALSMADRIVVLHQGRIEQVGTPQEIYRHPATLFVAGFIGQPRMNLLHGSIERNLLVPFGIPLLNRELPRHLDRVVLGLRPEAIEIRPDGEYVAQVAGVEYRGDSHTVVLRFKDQSLVVSRAMEPPPVGQTVNFTFDPGTLRLFDPETGRNLEIS